MSGQTVGVFFFLPNNTNFCKLMGYYTFGKLFKEGLVKDNI